MLLAGGAVVIAVVGVAGVGSAAGRRARRPSAQTAQPWPHTVFGTSWPVYHHDGLGSGVDPTGTDLSPGDTGVDVGRPRRRDLRRAPGGRAGASSSPPRTTPSYELAANTGAVLWSTHVGTAGALGEPPVR